MMINELRDRLIKEAKMSPMLLADLAGLETYISESYNNRSFIELLQNSDDALSTRFLVDDYNSYLVVANDGRPFNANDFESLCRSASSSKGRGTAIGYRGIGFKSVVSFAQEVHLISGEYNVTFSRELTHDILPTSVNVPLIRIPHPLKDEVKSATKSIIDQLSHEGYTTFFIFSGVLKEKINEEYCDFNESIMLFLKHIRSIEINLNKKTKASVISKELNEGERFVNINNSGHQSEWKIISTGISNLVFSLCEGKVKKLAKKDSIIHAFLPTEDISEIGILINSDFSTDPSRRHIIYDDTTISKIIDIVKLYYLTLKNALFDATHDSFETVSALVPYFDISLIHLGKDSFAKLFVEYLKKQIDNSFSRIKLCPSWFNYQDFSKIYPNNVLDYNISQIQGIEPLLIFLGAKKVSVNEVIFEISKTDVSVTGYAEIVAICIKNILLNQNFPDFVNCKLFYSKQKIKSLHEIYLQGESIDVSFLQILISKGVTEDNLMKCFEKYKLDIVLPHANRGLDESLNSTFKNNLTSLTSLTSLAEQNIELIQQTIASKRWRNAEEIALEILNLSGYALKDVSAQNLGYDLCGFDTKGQEVFMEVKSITHIGQTFRMTNNEFAIAQYQKGNYYIVVVLQSNNNVKIGLIKDPVNTLSLTRVCVQWNWECSNYSFNPIF